MTDAQRTRQALFDRAVLFLQAAYRASHEARAPHREVPRHD